MFNNILVTCVGNICRSPMASALLESKLKNHINVKSAGISALQGREADPIAIKLMQERAIDIKNHRAKILTKPDVDKADIIFAMEHHHVSFIKKQHPQSRGKVHLLGKWLNDTEIPDPYKKNEYIFNHSLHVPDMSINKWVGLING